MGDMDNPYKAPEAQTSPILSEEFKITGSMQKILAEAHPWIEFIAILMFIGTGIVALIGVFAFLFSSVGSLFDL